MSKKYSAATSVRLLLRRKWLILGVTILSALGAYLYARTLPNYYKATINVVPAQNDQDILGGSMGGLGSALKDFGLSKLSGSKGVQYEFIVVMFARSLRDSMIETFDLIEEYELQDKPMKAVREEFENNLEIELHAEGNYEISCWSIDSIKAVEMAETFVNYANSVANGIHRKDASKTANYLDERIALIDSALDALTDSLSRYSKDYLLFSPVDQAAASATGLSEAKATILKQETILGVLERSYGAEDPQVKSQKNLVRELQVQFENMQSQPGFAGNFSIKDAAGIGASYMRLLGEFEAYAKLKAFMLPTLEQARLDRMKSTPSLLVVDRPFVPEKKDRPRRSLIAAGTGIGFGILTMLIILTMQAWRAFMAHENEDK